MKEKISLGTLWLLFMFGGMALATTVACLDGQNYAITNDLNQVRNMTMDQINTQENRASAMVQNDGIRDLKDGEALADWQFVQQRKRGESIEAA